MKKSLFNTPDLIVSVESRKGGVGKTTAALCLARLLQKRNYAVLVLDLDVTGTNAADIADSPFWRDDLHVICEKAAWETDDSKKTTPINLLTLFDQSFMAGKAIPDFSTHKTDGDHMFVDLSRVNVLGSQIYKTDRGKGITCIDRPGILFDDLHTLWLLELVKQISDDFARVGRDRTKVAIVLDNSPGYVGIAPAIHEWLTDLGPQHGKFLTVTSLDVQDILACQKAIEVLHRLYTDKWTASLLFKGTTSSGEGIKVEKSQESFLVRLATVADNSSGAMNPLDFYRKECGQGEDGHVFSDNPGKYISVIINRVPKAVKTGRLVYEPEYDLESGEHVLSRLLGGNNPRRNWREWMISYDEYIENQFLLQSLRRGRSSPKWKARQLIDTLENAEHELRIDPTESEGDAIHFSEMSPSQCEHLKYRLARADDIVTRARSGLDDVGFGHLAGLIQDEWLPGTILPNFRKAFSTLLREGDFPYFEMLPFELQTDSMNVEQRGFVEEFKKNVFMRLPHMPPWENEDVEHRIAELLVGVLSGLVGLSLASPLFHSPVKEEMSELFTGVIAIELMHWRQRSEISASRYGVQHFLAQESVTPGELDNEMESEIFHRFFHRYMARTRWTNFSIFYKACTSAQARLMDFRADSLFLLHLIRFIVEGEINKGDLFPFVRGLVEDVIINKSVSHEEAPNRMAKALKTAEYFSDFDGVLRKVLSEWEVPRE